MPFCLIFVKPSYLFRVRVAQSKENKKDETDAILQSPVLEPIWTLAGSKFEILSDF